MRAIRRGRQLGDAGVTLPELLVTTLLMAIVGAMVASLVTSYSRTVTRERARDDSTNVAASGMNELTRVVRAATTIKHESTPGGFDPAFVYAGDERLIVNAAVDAESADPKPLRVEFVLDSGRVLTETRTTARAGTTGEAAWVFTGSGTSTTSRPIARTIVPYGGTGNYLFTYYDESGTQLVPPVGGSLSAAQIDVVSSVLITLQVQADPTGRAAPVTIVNRVGLRNLRN